MSNTSTKYFQWSMVQGVVVIEVTPRELSRKDAAQEWVDELRALHASKPSDRYIIDFRNTEFISSTAFSVVVLFSKEVARAGGSLVLCGMKTEVRLYAEILRMGRIVPIQDDLDIALATIE